MKEQQIILMVEKGLVALMALGLYIYLVSAVFPWLTMRFVWRGRAGSARGVGRVVFPEGRGVVCEPDLAYRRYIRRYALVDTGSIRFLQCEVHPRVVSLRYDIISFDRAGRLLDVVQVREHLNEPGYTHRITLPRNTSTVQLVLRRVDGVYRNKSRYVAYSRSGVILYTLLTVGSTVLLSWLLHEAITSVWAFLTPSLTGTSRLFALVAGGIAGGLYAGWTLLRYRHHSGKVVNK